MKTFPLALGWILTMMMMDVVDISAQKPNVEVSFTIAKHTPFHSKFKRFLTAGEQALYEQQVLDTLISGLNEYIAFANFQKGPQTMKLKIELNRKVNTGSDHYLIFTFDPGDGSDLGDHDFQYLNFNRLGLLNVNLPEAVEDLARVWYEHLEGNYDTGLTQKLFPNLYMIIPSGDHYRANYKVVLPESKSSLKLNTVQSKFTVAIAFQDNPNAFTPQNDRVYTEDCRDDVTVGVKKLWGCITVQLTEWEPNRNPIGGKIYFKEYKRQVYASPVPQF